MLSDDLICVGKIIAVRGVNGQFKIKSFTEKPSNLLNYQPILDNRGNPLDLFKMTDGANGLIYGFMNGCNNRDDAAKLIGTELFIKRSTLPALTNEEYYFHDLIGMEVLDESNTLIGKIIAVQDYGAGIFLEITDIHNKNLSIPFHSEAIIKIDQAVLVNKFFVI